MNKTVQLISDQENVYSNKLKKKDTEIAELVEMLEWCQGAVDPYLVDCRKLDELVNKYKKGK